MIRINNTQYFHFLQHADVLRRSGSLCDAIISVKSQTFRAHRLVLACASRALAQQLAQGGSDSPARCTLEFFSPHTFQQVLDFTYTQALDVSVDDLRLLLRAAQLLEMQQLEDQCRRQLDTLDRRASAQENKDVKVEKESAGERIQTPVQGDELREERQSVSAVTKKRTHPLKNHHDPVCTVKKSRLSPTTSALCRDTVITRPVGGNSSFSSPWTFTANMRESVSTLRRITENFISAHPLQYPHQSSAANPFSLAPPHMIPLLGSRFQSPVQSFVMGCSSFHPRYTQNLYVESTKSSSILKQGPLKRKQPGHRAFTGTAQNDKPGVPGSSQRDCQHCDTRALDDAVRPESASSQSGKRCAGCQLCGSGDVPQPEAEPRRNHRGEKPYQCQHCPKKFSLKHQLDTHHRVHTGEKPFECRLCGQRSRDYSAMIKHLRTHGGAAPYQCTVCLEFCSSLVTMQRHVKSHAVQDFPDNWNISSTYLYVSHI